MKRLVVLSLAALVQAPMAHAQTVCEEVARINTSGLYRFDSIKGAFATDEAEDELYESKATLFEEAGCLIDQFFEPRHVCTWEFDSEADVMAAYAAKASAMAPCFAGWEEQGLLVHNPDEPYRVLAGVGYLGAGIHEMIVWSILADFDVGREGKRYRLVIETVDYH